MKISGDHIHLRPVISEDADYMLAVENDPANIVFSSERHAYSLKDIQTYIQSINGFEKDGQFRWIILNDEGIKVGIIDLFEYDADSASAGVGIFINDDERRKGSASKAINLLKDYCFKNLKLRSLWASISPQNEASVSLFSSNGFIKGKINHQLSEDLNTEYYYFDCALSY